MDSIRRYVVMSVLLVVLCIFTSAKQCGNMSCDWNADDECYLFYTYRGSWYYQSKYKVQRGFVNTAKSESCYKYVVKRNIISTSCLDMEKYCKESGGAPAVINSLREYQEYNEFVLDVTNLKTFDPVYRKFLVHVDSLPMAGLNRTCSQVFVKDGWLTDNGGYILNQPCAEKTIVNSILCEYNSKIKTEPICAIPTPTPTPKPATTTLHTTTTLTQQENVTIPMMSSTMFPTPNRDVRDDRKTIGFAATTVTIIGLLIMIIALLSCMLLYIGKQKHKRKQERYVVRAHQEIRSVHLYDSPLDDWMDKPYLVASQKQTLYSNSDETNSTRLSDVTDETNKDHYITTSTSSTNSYENHHPTNDDNEYLCPISRNQDQTKEYYNVSSSNLDTLDASIIKRIYNPLRPQKDLVSETSTNKYKPTKPVKYNYDKLSRSSTMVSMPNQFKSKPPNVRPPNVTPCRPPKGIGHCNIAVQYMQPGAVKTGYHHLERRCATMNIGGTNDHDYSRLTMSDTAT